MALAVERERNGFLREVSTEEIQIKAPWEGVWPAKLANNILPPSIVLLRLTMGWIFAWAGFDKLIRGFDSSGFLVNATRGRWPAGFRV